MESVKGIMAELQERVNLLRQTKTNHSTQENLKNLGSNDCPKCKGAEGFFYKVDGVEYWRDCECVIKRRTERLIQASQITDSFRQMSFDNFEWKSRPVVVQQAFATAFKYAKGFEAVRKERSNGLCLLGNPGAGKTHLLMATANSLLNRGIEVIYFPWVEGCADLKASFDLLPEKIYRLQTVEVLYIDDLFKGRQKPTDFQLEQIFAIINYRYLNQLPIMISSEWTIARMCDFDEATGSRINEMCREYKVVLDEEGLNYRLKDEV
ncbi:phage-like element PBSX protein XkdC [Paenibacillus macerans]|nr:phage-like element PBSX protein XkdC [Paenibacillus macerans]